MKKVNSTIQIHTNSYTSPTASGGFVGVGMDLVRSWSGHIKEKEVDNNPPVLYFTIKLINQMVK
ncbi:MAG: hypothetical protein WD491_09675 [Balneolales bacterium]